MTWETGAPTTEPHTVYEREDKERRPVERGMSQENVMTLQHQLRMGDITILPEDLGRVNQEIAWGASLDSLKKGGLIR